MPRKRKSPAERVKEHRIRGSLVLGPWFRPVPRKANIPEPVMGAREIRRKDKVQKRHPGWFDGRIQRIGTIQRKSTRNTKAVSLPMGETTYFTRLSHVKGQRHLTRAIKERSIPKRKQAPKRFEKSPYTLGANAIVELVDKKGKPTHIIMIKRPKNVEAPGSFDFVAGLIQPGKTPVELLKTRMKKEVGIPKSKISVIGKGFKKSKTGETLALYLTDKLLNYDTVYVMRAQVTPEELKGLFAKAQGEWKPDRIEFIKRKPEAVREFTRKNRNKILMPEVLRLYARELALHPGKGGKRKRAKER